jgi:hypothetical protein
LLLKPAFKPINYLRSVVRLYIGSLCVAVSTAAEKAEGLLSLESIAPSARQTFVVPYVTAHGYVHPLTSRGKPIDSAAPHVTHSYIRVVLYEMTLT